MLARQWTRQIVLMTANLQERLRNVNVSSLLASEGRTGWQELQATETNVTTNMLM